GVRRFRPVAASWPWPQFTHRQLLAHISPYPASKSRRWSSTSNPRQRMHSMMSPPCTPACERMLCNKSSGTGREATDSMEVLLMGGEGWDSAALAAISHKLEIVAYSRGLMLHIYWRDSW